MTDKTDEDIDDVLVKLAYKHKLQNELTYEKGTYCVDYPTFNYAHLFKDIKQLCIESDEAREYWVGFIDDSVLKKVKELENEREHFIEQACDAVEVRKNKLLEINESMPAKEQAMLVAGLCEAEQAIRDKFEGEK